MQRRYHLRWTLLACFFTLPVCNSGVLAQPSIPTEDKPIQIQGRLVRSGLITRAPSQIPEDLSGLEMLRDRLGVVAALDSSSISSLNRFARSIESSIDGDEPPPLYLQFSHGTDRNTLGIYPQTETVILQTLDAPRQAWTIRREAFNRLGISIDPSDVSSPDWFEATASAQETTIAPPHVQSDLTLDKRTVRSRIKSNFPALTRVVGDETFHVRLPKGFDPLTPSGVLVCISPSPMGRIHESFALACDQLGLIAIGVDNNGNKREITDRLQNHLDSIETLAMHARIDRDRIYLTGMSGGGRCSGILQLAFPERFAGAVPIVGLDTYHNAPTGKGNQYWPKSLGKPSSRWMKFLQTRRIRSITGTADFNEPEMLIRTELLNRDGIDAQIDVIEGMAHSYPSQKQFRDALLWVDEPRREQIAEALDDARNALQETKGKDTGIPAIRRRLIEIMKTVPYTPESWEAASRLGYPQSDN